MSHPHGVELIKQITARELSRHVSALLNAPIIKYPVEVLGRALATFIQCLMALMPDRPRRLLDGEI